MKIVFINPRKLDTPNHPLGILYLAAVLEREGHEVIILDPNEKLDNSEVVKKILSHNPQLVGFTATTIQIVRGLGIAKELRASSKVPIIFGGVHPTILINDVLNNEFVDFVVYGEGEETIRGLVKELEGKKSFDKIKGLAYKVNKSIKINPPRPLISNLDSLPFPATHLLKSKWYFAPPRIRGTWTKSLATILSGRGCPYRCVWCGSHLMFDRKVRKRSVSNVIKEILYQRKEFDIDSIRFMDDTFTANHKWVTEFCNELKKLNLKNFNWFCTTRVDTVNYSLLKLMRESGCKQVDFGIESGSQKVLNILKKDIDINKIVQAVNMAKKAGLRVCASFIVGTPGETKEDVLMTAKLLDRLNLDFAEFFFATPYPGTELYRMAEESSLFNKDIPYDQWISSKQSDKPVMCIGSSEEEIIKYRSMLHNKMFLRNYLTLLKDPRFIIGSMSIIAKGWKGFPNGIKRFMKTGKVDSIFVEVLKSYRDKIKED